MHSLIYTLPPPHPLLTPSSPPPQPLPTPPKKTPKKQKANKAKKKQKQKQKSDYDKFRKLTNKIPLIPFLVNSETGGLQLFFTDNFLEKLARTVNLLLHFCTYCFLRGFVDCLSLYLGFYCNSRPLFSLRSEKAYSGSRQTSMMELFYKNSF